ncbi:hypothetical protein GCM10027055_12900 [Janibacter alkaliphilus]|uniref:WXG100 family type VII secretion target n=1 Tax=Janibacter alkaliphilus TaxID=1069963 RepID=A0A852X499_9MICO|nr:hypothetical protein [Janibacter alkaliphilus]
MSGADPMACDPQGVYAGDPDALLAQADELSLVAENLMTVRRCLYDLAVHAVWDSPAGSAFQDQLGRVPAFLETVAERYRESAEVIVPYADRLRTDLDDLREREDTHTDLTISYERARSRVHASDLGSPERAELVRERDELAERLQETARGFATLVEDIQRRDRDVGRELDAIAEVGDDSWIYDTLEWSSRTGDGARENIVTDVMSVPIIGAPGDVGRKIAYDEGDWGDLGSDYGWQVAALATKPLSAPVKAISKVPWLNTGRTASTRRRPRGSGAMDFGTTPTVKDNPLAQSSLADAGRALGRRARKKTKQRAIAGPVEDSVMSWASVVGTNKVAEAASRSYAVARATTAGGASTTSQWNRVDAVDRRLSGRSSDVTEERARMAARGAPVTRPQAPAPQRPDALGHPARPVAVGEPAHPDPAGTPAREEAPRADRAPEGGRDRPR